MENALPNQWAFSWNALQKKVNPPSSGVPVHGRIQAVAQCWTTFPLTLGGRDGKNPLVTPSPSGWNPESAVGGGLIDQLNRAGAGMPYGEVPISPGRDGREMEKLHSATLEKSIYRFFHRGSPLYHLTDVVDCVEKQIKSFHWAQIYDPQEIHRGMRSRDRITDDYKNQLAECRKIAILYGNLSRKTLHMCMQLAIKQGGDADSAFLSALERRLDVALKRILFFPTIKSARQWICQGKICVNHQPVTICSYQLQPGDHIAIKGGERESWRKQCLHSLASPTGANGEPPLPKGGTDKVPTFQKTNSLPGGKSPSSHLWVIQPAMENQRRFLFSPLFLKKWKRWSQLWGKEEHTPRGDTSQSWEWPHLGGYADISSSFVGTSGLGERLTNKDATCDAAVPLAGGLAGRHMRPLWLAGCTLRRESGCTKWFRFSLGGWKKPPEIKSGRKIHSTRSTAATQWTIPPLRRKYAHRQWLHHQQRLVVDGLYHIRSNRLHAERKSPGEKKRDWRWSCMKPMHFECNYKQCSAIFLYPPQKLARPSSINCSLLRKALL